METFSTLLAICAGNSPVPGEFPTQRPVARGFDIFFDLQSNKRLSKQWRGWWFETQSCPLWRHCNELVRSPWLLPDRNWRRGRYLIEVVAEMTDVIFINGCYGNSDLWLRPNDRWWNKRMSGWHEALRKTIFSKVNIITFGVSMEHQIDCLFNELFKLTKTIKAPHNWSYVRRFRSYLMNSPHKGPVMRKVFPCLGVFMGSWRAGGSEDRSGV